jgi:hypothetical protein
MTTVATATFASAAIAASGSCNLFASSFPSDPAKHKMVALSLTKTTPPDIARTILADPGNVFQYLCIINGHTAVLTRPFPASNEYNVSVLLANCGDTMDFFTPVSLPTKYHHGHLISLVPSHIARELDWNRSDVDPAQLEPPGAADLEPGEETKAIEPMDHIHWNTNGPADEPKFTAIRALLPLPTGINPPWASTYTMGFSPPTWAFALPSHGSMP